jgi:hypothetical protein
MSAVYRYIVSQLLSTSVEVNDEITAAQLYTNKLFKVSKGNTTRSSGGQEV